MVPMLRLVSAVSASAALLALVVAACSPSYGVEEPAPGADAGRLEDGAATGDALAPAASCSPGERTCFGVCKRSDDPSVGCGATDCVACDPRNAGAARCNGSATGFACDYEACAPGFQDCDGNRGNGCETPATDPRNCGACGRECSGATPVCARAPSDGSVDCAASCPAGTTQCGGACVDVTSDLQNCGACGQVCSRANATSTCANSTCTHRCNVGTKACGSVCVSVADPAYCGAKCAPCPAAPNTVAFCSNETCAYACRLGFYDCDGQAGNGCESTVARLTPCGVNQTCLLGLLCCDGLCRIPGPGSSCPG